MPRIKSRCFEDMNDFERLQDRLEWDGFSETKVKSDGNCQFRALADQLYNNSESHKLVREEVIKQLKSHPKLYKGFIGIGKTDLDFSMYVKKMSNNSVWGDDLTLKAAADAYRVKIIVITSIESIPFIVILPKSSQNQYEDKVIYLSYLAGVHFNSIHLNNKGSGLGSSLIELHMKKSSDKEEVKKEEEEKEKEKENKNQKKKRGNKKKKK